MHAHLSQLSHDLYELLQKLEAHVPPADAEGRRLLYESKQKLKEIADAAQQTA
jgi:hypothetical protein